MSRNVLHVALAIGVMSLSTAAAFGQSEFDIVGIKPGMTESQALEAIKAHDPRLKITVKRAAHAFSDGVQQHQTAPFLSHIEARLPGGPSRKPELAVYFTSPPQGGKVWAIERNEAAVGEPPTRQQYVAALQKKYGAPSATSTEMSRLAWNFPSGRVDCIPKLPGDPAAPVFAPSGRDEFGFLLRNWQQRKLAPADLSKCASRLHYVLGGSPVTQFSAVMIDVAAFAAADAALQRELQTLEQNARRQRDAKGQVPKI